MKYGVKENLSSNIIREKIKQTFKRKYNCETIGQLIKNESIKNKQAETNYIKYNECCVLNIPEVRKKLYHSNIQKGRISKNENILYNMLLKYFDKNDIDRQHKEQRYPYWCDFYIKSIDTFIEYQGTWLHGFHPYDENNLEDVKQIEYWVSKKSNYYNQAIRTWTSTDVQKRNKAKQSNMRYIEIFSLNNIDFNKIKNNTENKHIIYL